MLQESHANRATAYVFGMDLPHTLIFGLYGLAFFSLGLVLALEAGRTRGLPLGRFLWPLAVFGLLHGLHEWLELLMGLDVFLALGELAVWLRLGLLALSFASLLAYGVQVFRPPEHLAALDAWIGAALLSLYIAGALWLRAIHGGDSRTWFDAADALSRYMLGVPGALLAWRAVARQTRQRVSEGRLAIAGTVRWMSAALFGYALSQMFVPRSPIFLASLVNTDTFLALTGVPIQVGRVAAAAVLALAAVRATQLVEQERLQEVETAHRERLAALEQAQAELARREALQRELLRHTVVTQEEERARIARELHDETSQALTALSLQLAALENALPANPAAAATGAATARQLTHEMAERLKRLVSDLRPAQLDNLGLTHALSALVDNAGAGLGLQVEFAVEGQRRRLDPRAETALYRIAQEALTNVARHACTRRAQVRLSFQSDQICLQVSDQGRGCQLASGEESTITGWGLAGMRERAEQVGGLFGFASQPQVGTTVRVCIPLT
ncbi:MAG: sensor histidine kinase [Chloroflexi bacterium]|nr:sensor histidine kinase [Chloroflexota bacterium]